MSRLATRLQRTVGWHAHAHIFSSNAVRDGMDEKWDLECVAKLLDYLDEADIFQVGPK